MSELVVRQVLESRLEAWADDRKICVQFENRGFDAPVDTIYLKATVLFAPTVENDAVDGETISGIFQIDIMGLPQKGAAEVGQLHADLKALFPLDQILDAGGFSVMQRSPLSLGPAIPDNARYQVPTRFQFIAYT